MVEAAGQPFRSFRNGLDYAFTSPVGLARAGRVIEAVPTRKVLDPSAGPAPKGPAGL